MNGLGRGVSVTSTMPEASTPKAMAASSDASEPVRGRSPPVVPRIVVTGAAVPVVGATVVAPVVVDVVEVVVGSSTSGGRATATLAEATPWTMSPVAGFLALPTALFSIVVPASLGCTVYVAVRVTDSPGASTVVSSMTARTDPPHHLRVLRLISRSGADDRSSETRRVQMWRELRGEVIDE